jgi:hypothetical protein
VKSRFVGAVTTKSRFTESRAHLHGKPFGSPVI